MHSTALVRVRVAAVALVMALVWGCSDDSSDGSNDCVPGQSIACACTNGEMGAQVCQDSGAFGACSCDSTPDGGGTANACGGSGELRLNGVATAPGDACGDCGDGVAACAGPETMNCVGSIGLNACGACQTLNASPGDACGQCSTGALACAEDGGLECGVVDELNACGGCEELAQDPFFTCSLGEATGVFYCRDEATVVCVGPDENACGGSDELGELPTSRCGACQQGRYACDGQNAVVCEKADAGVNSCGGCAPLAGEPGEECECGGSWQCSGAERVVCSRGNLCGGCAELTALPGSSCGSQRINVCDGAEALRCADESEANACGGAETLLAMPGDSCGECGDGTRICVSPNAVACRGASRTNACGGCTYLAESPGDPCGSGGTLECDGTDGFRCVGEAGDNGCGGTTMLPAVPGTDCECGTWVCEGADSIVCDTPVDVMTNSEHCGMCGNACDPNVACVSGRCEDPMGQPARAVAAGNSHSCATDGATVWCWGKNDRGQLGIGNNATRRRAATVSGLTDVVKLAAGFNHTCAVSSNGSLSCWGDNSDGQLGRGISGGSGSSPQVIAGLTGVTDVAAGSSHTCAISGGEVYCWGSTQQGQVGDGTTAGADVESPKKIGSFTGASQIAAGDDFTCVIDGAGAVSCWGSNDSGQLADGTTGGTQATPQTVTSLTAIGIGAGSKHACAILTAGSVQCWGNNDYQQTGTSSFGSVTTPSQVNGASSVVSMDAGRYHTCALRNDETVICWGDDDGSGMPAESYNPPLLGNGSLAGSATPVPVSSISGADALAVGEQHTCVFVDTGHVSCWGEGRDGRLGDNQMQTAAARLEPVDVVGIGSPRTEASQCLDGVDNDGAGGADCDDMACATEIVGGTATGDLLGEGNYFDYNMSSCGSGGFGGNGADQLFKWVAPSSGTTTVQAQATGGSSFGGTVVVFEASSCPGAQLVCGDSFSAVTFTAVSGTTYHVLVEAYDYMGQGYYYEQNFQLTISQ